MTRPFHDLTRSGWVMLGASLVLIAAGTASIYVTDTHYVAGHDGPANAVKQMVRVIVAAGVAAVMLYVGYAWIARRAYLFFLVVLLLLIPLLVSRLAHFTFGGLTAPRNGAYRWLHFPGFPMQPSEFMKIAYVLALAWYLRFRENYRRFAGLMIPVVCSVLPLSLILLEPDLGTALLLVPVLLVMLFAAGARKRHLTVIVLLGLAAAPLAWGQIKGYQRARVTAVLLQSEDLRRAVIDDPERYRFLTTKRQAIEWAASSGYQLVHSKNAIGSGGLFGEGWGDGVYVRSALLPDRHNDFVFALIGQQWGFVGCVVVLLCYLIIVLAGVQIVSATTDPVGRLVGVGITTLMAVQVLINVGMAVGLMPITGMTLPLVSYGGSSILSSFMALALLVSVSQHRPYLLATRPFEYSQPPRARRHLVEHRGITDAPSADGDGVRTRSNVSSIT